MVLIYGDRIQVRKKVKKLCCARQTEIVKTIMMMIIMMMIMLLMMMMIMMIIMMMIMMMIMVIMMMMLMLMLMLILLMMIMGMMRLYILYIYVHVIDLYVMRLFGLFGRRASASSVIKRETQQNLPSATPQSPFRCSIMPLIAMESWIGLFGVRLRPRKRSSFSATLIRGTLASTGGSSRWDSVHLVYILSSVQFASSGYGCMAVPCSQGDGWRCF